MTKAASLRRQSLEDLKEQEPPFKELNGYNSDDDAAAMLVFGARVLMSVQHPPVPTSDKVQDASVSAMHRAPSPPVTTCGNWSTAGAPMMPSP
eukprot:12213-Prymnesium_polylepis.1